MGYMIPRGRSTPKLRSGLSTLESLVIVPTGCRPQSVTRSLKFSIDGLDSFK